MPRYFLPIPPLLAALVGALSAAEPVEVKFATPAESKAAFEKSVGPFLAKHCAECHNAKNPKGDLDLTALDPDMKATTSGARWATVVEKLANGEMPPKSKPRPSDAELVAVGRWAHAEAKRAGRPFTRRAAYANGNSVPHHVLFDPANVPPFDGGPRVRRLSPEIYAAFTNDLAKGRPGIGQPFSPEGKSTFKDMGAPKMDEPVTAQLIQNALPSSSRRRPTRSRTGR
jgi:mono/diheme cytochrome c family protein